MLTVDEEKLIRRYCLLARLPIPAVIAALVTAFLPIVPEAVLAVGFHEAQLSLSGLYADLAVVACLLAIFTYAMLTLSFGMRGERWRALEEQMLRRLGRQPEEDEDAAAVAAASLGAMTAGRQLSGADNETLAGLGDAAQAVGGIGAVAAAAGRSNSLQRRADMVAACYGVALPAAKSWILCIILLPCLVLAGVYVPRFVSAAQVRGAQASAVAVSEQKLTDAFAAASYRVSCDKPKLLGSSSYTVICSSDEADERYLMIELDAGGQVKRVSYCANVSLQADRQQQLTAFAAALVQMNDMLRGAGVSPAAPGLTAANAVPDALASAFLRGPDGQDYFDVAEADGLDFSFSATVENRTEDSPPYLYLSVRTA